MKAKPSSALIPVLIIGIGNDLRGDDGVGLVVARQLFAELPPSVTVREATGEGAALMDAWKDASTVILIDAVQADSAPGTVHRIDAKQMPLPTRFFRYSTHAFSVAEAVEVARLLHGLPPKLIVYGIEGKSFKAGEAISPEVLEAAGNVARSIRNDLDDLSKHAKAKGKDHARVFPDE